MGWGIYFLVMQRLDRLGRQVEAVRDTLQMEVARTPERRAELSTEWKENRELEAKDKRQFWWTWSIIGVVVILGWIVFAR